MNGWACKIWEHVDLMSYFIEKTNANSYRNHSDT